MIQTVGSEKTTEGKNMNKIFTGLSRDFLGILFVFFSSQRNDPPEAHKQICATHPVLGQCPKFVYVYSGRN